MTNICVILLGLAFAILLILLLSWLIIRLTKVRKRKPSFCNKLCRIRIVLAFLVGMVFGAFLCFCRGNFAILFSRELCCLSRLFLVLLLALFAAICLLFHVIKCGGFFLPKLTIITRLKTRIGYGIYTLIIILVILVLWSLLQCCDWKSLFSTVCGRLIVTIAFLLTAFLIIYALEIRFCPVERPNPEICRREILRWSIILLVALVLAFVIVRICYKDLCDLEADLAMVGIYWNGKYSGEQGAHLRWAFRYGLPFPQNGFDLFRRPSDGSGSWTLLNTEGRIHPMRVWNGPVPGPDIIWKGRGKERLSPVLHSRFEGPNAENATNLLDMLGYAPYDTLYYVEGRDDPFFTRIDAETFVAGASEPLFQWETVPMTLLLTMALHSEIANLLGLYYIDETADSTVEYDYRVVGYWDDRTRSYTVEKLSRTNTASLTAPSLDKADVQVSLTRQLPDGSFWPTEALVALHWEPLTLSPDLSLTITEGIKPVMYLPQREDIGSLNEPATTPGANFQPLQRPDDQGIFEPIDPIIVLPQEIEGAPDQWPEYFARDNWVEYRQYAYRVIGIDIFGRQSIPSNYLTVEVRDVVGPVAPINIEAFIYQRDDPATARLAAGLENELFPPDNSNTLAVRVSWLWPNYLRVRYPDLKEFRVYYKFEDYSTFADPNNVSLWRDAEEWDGFLASVPKTDIQPGLPPRFEDPDNPGTFTVPPSDYYEVIITDLPASLVSLISADDDNPVVYGFITIAAVDHDPFNNCGSTGPPVTVLTRDFTPPDPPAAPILIAEPGEADNAGYVPLTLRIIGTDERYTYQIYRVRGQTLLTLPPPIISLPTVCIPDPQPEVMDLQRRAYENPDRYKLVTSIPLEPFSISSSDWVVDFTDRVDATISQRYLYAARAIDPAGNLSDFSCPSLEVLSRDRMPPRPPVVTKVVGGESSIILTWIENEESDLKRYELYYTAEKERLNNKRKMTLILATNPNGEAISPTATAPDATVVPVAGERYFQWVDPDVPAGETYYYRLVAVDLAENSSKMSDVVSGRAVDTIPPVAPEWISADPIIWVTNPEGRIILQLTWQTIPDEPNVRVQIQRQHVGGSPAWLSITGWITETTYQDHTALANESYIYRLRAVDRIGNRSDWSSYQTSPTVP